ncbi:MAG: hypothetical protein ACYDEV_04410 [Acidiferrobacter sp.]
MTSTQNPHFVTLMVGKQTVDVTLDWLSISRYNAYIRSTPKGMSGTRLGIFLEKKLGELDSHGITPETIYYKDGSVLW